MKVDDNLLNKTIDILEEHYNSKSVKGTITQKEELIEELKAVRYDRLSHPDPEKKLKTQRYKLDRMFDMQRTLIKLLREKNKYHKEDDKKDLAMDIIMSMSNELEELRDWFPWKCWKTYPKNFTIKWSEVELEVIDLMHFLIEFAIVVCQIDADKFFRIFKNKHQTNLNRHEGGY